ncbi:MAG: DUF4423 domain-containing protein [Proteobacteria bacterium]|nr:DUF4423 domain-containing protein [Pseudomonadota bacterium]
MTSLNISLFLSAELGRRKENNPRYSLRAFAKLLDLDPGYLSSVIARKRILSMMAAHKVSIALKLSDLETRKLLEAAGTQALERTISKQGFTSKKSQIQIQEIDQDIYASISDMIHYLILEGTFLRDFQPDARWISRRFNVTVIEAEQAIARLIRLGLLTSSNGAIVKSSQSLITKDLSKTNSALKASQRQILKSALKALENDPIEHRDTTGMTMSIDPKKIPLAKQMIQDFTNQLCEMLESGERTEVFQLSVSLFSLERNLTTSV